METIKIEKDKYLNCWVVWEIHNNYSIDRYHAKTKRECKRWLSAKNATMGK
jgi:hypothetical protein